MIVRRGHRRGKAKCGTNRPSAEKNLCGGFGRGDGIIFASTGKRKVEVFMRGSMASRTQASARVNRQPRIKRRIFKRFGGCGSNLSQQQRPRDGKNAISGSWSRRRDLRLWRRAPVNSPPGCSVCAHPICFRAIRAQAARSPLAPPPSNPVDVRNNGKESRHKSALFSVSLIYEIAAQAVKKYRIAHRRKRRVPHRNQQTAETSNK